MIYAKELEEMCHVAKGVDHGPAPIPEEGKWVKAKAHGHYVREHTCGQSGAFAV